MENPSYRIVFKGEICEGFNPQRVQQTFLSRFHVPKEKLDQFFSGKTIVLKSSLSKARAQKIQAAVAAAGAKAYIVPEQPKRTMTPPIPAPTKTHMPPGPSMPVHSDWDVDSPFAAPNNEPKLHKALPKVPPIPPQAMLEKKGTAPRIDGPVGWQEQPSLELGKPLFDAPPPENPDPFRQGETGPPSVYDPSYLEVRKRQEEKLDQGRRRHQLGLALLVGFFCLLIIAFSLRRIYFNWDIHHAPGVLVPLEPIQVRLNDEAPISHKNFIIQPLATFQLQARVLSRKDYSFDASAKLAPIDLALGWGRMSDEAVLKHIDISQSGRFYFWRVAQFPIPRREIERFSANMHMIPADQNVLKTMKKVKRGHLIGLKGYLVKVQSVDGFTWQSSLTRDDTGAGACEVIYVTDFDIFN